MRREISHGLRSSAWGRLGQPRPVLCSDIWPAPRFVEPDEPPENVSSIDRLLTLLVSHDGVTSENQGLGFLVAPMQSETGPEDGLGVGHDPVAGG